MGFDGCRACRSINIILTYLWNILFISFDWIIIFCNDNYSSRKRMNRMSINFFCYCRRQSQAIHVNSKVTQVKCPRYQFKSQPKGHSTGILGLHNFLNMCKLYPPTTNQSMDKYLISLKKSSQKYAEGWPVRKMMKKSFKRELLRRGNYPCGNWEQKFLTHIIWLQYLCQSYLPVRTWDHSF